MAREAIRGCQQVAQLRLAILSGRLTREGKAAANNAALKALVGAAHVPERAGVEAGEECFGRIALLVERDAVREGGVLEVAVQVLDRQRDEAAVAVGPSIFDLEAGVRRPRLAFAREAGRGPVQLDDDLVGAAPQSVDVPAVLRVARPLMVEHGPRFLAALERDPPLRLLRALDVGLVPVRRGCARVERILPFVVDQQDAAPGNMEPRDAPEAQAVAVADGEPVVHGDA